MSPLVMVHLNPAEIDNGVLKIDRKFHEGMQTYAQNIRAPIVAINPQSEGEEIMDPIKVPLSQLPYRVMTFKIDKARRPLDVEIPRLRSEIKRAKLLYGDGFGTPEIAHSVGVPYILILECDLKTNIIVNTVNVKSPVRRAIRAAKSAWYHRLRSVPEMRRAHSLHCNGYPIYDATRRYNANSLLYFDSRMSKDMIMPLDELNARLARRAERPLRLLFSGRYERMKGSDDAVRVAVECLRRGLDIEMHFYGQGSLRSEMARIANQAPPGSIYIHDAIPYTQLVTISRTFDLFVCCHIQSDPSCTYLESFGAGLPIVGYGNRMWSRLSEASGAGLVSAIGCPDKVADDVYRFMSESGSLASMSRRALAFALAHNYEAEFGKRIDALNAAIG